MNIRGSDRLGGLGSAIFAEVAAWKKEAIQNGRDIIDLGIGSPDQPPSDRVIEALADAVRNPNRYGYPSSEGSLAFRTAVADWYMHRFGVVLDPESEVLTLMGSQDGLAHLAMSICDPGDLALVPDPGYPIYAASLVLAGVEGWRMPLRADHGFLPRFEEIPSEIAKRAKFMLLNYPSNPLSVVADEAFFTEAVSFCREHDILLVHDLAYSEMAFDGVRPMSVLELPGAKDIAVEFHSLSKSFNLAGCRIAFMVGHPQAVAALRMLKSNIDYGVFSAVQEAGIVALREDMERPLHGWAANTYTRRRDVFVSELNRVGWPISPSKATMFLWASVPAGWTSRQISQEMLLSTGVVVIPGDAFGQEGEGYVRIALVQPEDRLLEAAKRIGEFLQSIASK
jgi:LL-diaminopimelate aminotransferase